jgi:hypothetical protein
MTTFFPASLLPHRYTARNCPSFLSPFDAIRHHLSLVRPPGAFCLLPSSFSEPVYRSSYSFSCESRAFSFFSGCAAGMSSSSTIPCSVYETTSFIANRILSIKQFTIEKISYHVKAFVPPFLILLSSNRLCSALVSAPSCPYSFPASKISCRGLTACRSAKYKYFPPPHKNSLIRFSTCATFRSAGWGFCPR